MLPGEDNGLTKGHYITLLKYSAQNPVKEYSGKKKHCALLTRIKKTNPLVEAQTSGWKRYISNLVRSPFDACIVHRTHTVQTGMLKPIRVGAS